MCLFKERPKAAIDAQKSEDNQNTLFCDYFNPPPVTTSLLIWFCGKKLRTVVNVAKVLRKKAEAIVFFNRFLVYREKRHIE